MSRLIRIAAVQERAWKDILEEMLSLRIASGAAPRTIKDYRARIGLFFKKYPEAWGNYETLRKAVIDYFVSLADKAPATHNLAREYLGAFFNYCVESGHLPANPLKGIRKRKDDSKPRSLPEEIVLKLLSAPDLTTWPGLRDYALILLMLDTGIRPQESLRLEPRCFNLKSREVTVPAKYAKTRTERTLPISPGTRDVLQRVLEVRPVDWGADVPLFANCEGGELSPVTLARRLKEYGMAFGANITPYMLRHTFAINYLRNGGNVFALQRILGHMDLTMTKRYLALAQCDIESGHDKASPTMQFLAKRHRLRSIKGR